MICPKADVLLYEDYLSLMRKPYQSFKLATKLQDKLLSKVHTQLTQQQQLLYIIKAALPESLAKQIHYTVINQNKAVIFSSSAAYATQLRFYATGLLHSLSQHKSFAHIDQILIRLLLNSSAMISEPRTANMPSTETIRLLAESRRSNSNDNLAQALQSLSRTLEKLKFEKDATH